MTKVGKHRIGIYPGTFDPVTKGHLHLIKRASKLVDHLVVGVAPNARKQPLFSQKERLEMVRTDIANMYEKYCEVEVRGFDKLLIHFARDLKAACIFRGLRAVSDFEYEIQMANMNARMEPNIETIFLMASDRHQFIASSLVKDIARLGGDTSQFVSKKVFERLKAKYKKS